MLKEKRQEFGQYIVADPEICGGELTFKGTRIFVKDVFGNGRSGDTLGTDYGKLVWARQP